MRKNSCGTVDILKTGYDPKISKVPELIGKHPGVIAPVTLAKVNPLEIVKPASASRVSGMMEVEVVIRDGNEELQKNLKKIVLTIDGKRFECDKPPYKIDFDTSYAKYRMLQVKAEAIGTEDGQDNAVLASFYTNVIAENGRCDKSKPLLLFAGVFEPKIENRRETWTPETLVAAADGPALVVVLDGMQGRGRRERAENWYAALQKRLGGEGNTLPRGPHLLFRGLSGR